MTKREQQQQLCKFAKSDNPMVASKAITELMKVCEPIISSMVYVLSRTENVDSADLRSAGKLGVMKAIRDFKPQFRNTFKTYAAFWICGAMVDCVWDSQPVYMPPSERNLRKSLFDELRKRGDKASSDVMEYLSVKGVEYEENTHEEVHEEENNIDSEIVHDLLEELTPRQREIMCKLYGLDSGVEQDSLVVSEHYGITPSRVTQINQIALAKMRKSSKFVK